MDINPPSWWAVCLPGWLVCRNCNIAQMNLIFISSFQWRLQKVAIKKKPQTGVIKLAWNGMFINSCFFKLGRFRCTANIEFLCSVTVNEIYTKRTKLWRSFLFFALPGTQRVTHWWCFCLLICCHILASGLVTILPCQYTSGLQQSVWLVRTGGVLWYIPEENFLFILFLLFFANWIQQRNHICAAFYSLQRKLHQSPLRTVDVRRIHILKRCCRSAWKGGTS